MLLMLAWMWCLMLLKEKRGPPDAADAGLGVVPDAADAGRLASCAALQ